MSNVPEKDEIIPTEEQLQIIDAATDLKDNLIITAYAGAAKTTTLALIANHREMRKTAILYLAFNKKTADEMREKVPSTAVAKTMNALGHAAWQQRIGVRPKLNRNKMYELLGATLDTEPKVKVKEALYKTFPDLLKAVKEAKVCGWVPESCKKPHTELFNSDEDFFQTLDLEFNLEEKKLITKVIHQSIAQALDGIIDFDDQIYMPTLFAASFPKYPLILIDEAQDLSPLQHLMLVKLKATRYIAVGDSCQAIYGFRGAADNSMELMQKQFDMFPLLLSVSFRCSKAIVHEARWRAPAMQFPDWAIAGSVNILTKWTADRLPVSATIICRNNAPLFKCAVRLLAEGRYTELVGNDIGQNLIKILKKFGKPDQTTAAEVHAKIREWLGKQLKRSRPHMAARLNDQALCLHIFANTGDMLSDIIGYATNLLNQVGPIKLMTGHKSKGLEFPDVFILDSHLCDVKNTKGQDRNVLYVMQTRAKENLTYITSENYEGENYEEKLR